MATSNEKAIAALNELIEVCKNGEKGFAEAAEDIKDPMLQARLAQYANERARFADELQQQVVALGGKPDTGGSVAGAVHRGWINVKAAITGKDDHAILEECERGEDVAKDTYEKAVNGNDLPGTILPMVEQQYRAVKNAHDQVRDLRDSVPAGRR